MYSQRDAPRSYSPVGAHPVSSNSKIKRIVGAVVLVVIILGFWRTFGSTSGRGNMQIATWNIAAINNNPFEYWITHDDPAYNNMMDAVQEFIENPGSSDVLVSDVFTQEMFDTLVQQMTNVGWIGIEETKELWETDYKHRNIISGFMKDGELGLKRLASMPDRTTNTVALADGSAAYRPTVINCYDGKIKNLDSWFQQWIFFMFKQRMKIAGSEGVTEKSGYELLVPIKRSKYPALTEAEEEISIPLQTMCGAIFDSILVNIVMSVEPDQWQSLRTEMCEALNLKKNDHTLQILSSTYIDRDIIFLQEAASSFIELARADADISNTFAVLAPAKLSKRNQNSAILLRKEIFETESYTEITSQVESELPGDAPVAVGDIFSISVSNSDGSEHYMLSSFHGDTNGLATIPVTTAVHNTKTSHFADHILIFGLDANTYEHATPGKTQDVLEYAKSYVKLGLTSCWGDTPDPTQHTTYSARTYLQPQLNKAAKKDELVQKGDVNPKDFVLFYPHDFSPASVGKDNTGHKKFIEGMVFPTLDFPSDHGVLRTSLVPQ